MICFSCDKISHAKCALKLYNFNQILDRWSCWECVSTAQHKYNPFESIIYDKHIQDEAESLHEISQISQILQNCESYSPQQLDKLFHRYESPPFSILFNNIDGVKSNFDKLSAELSLLKNEFSVITLAETNIDSCNKDLFGLNGFQSVYQSKLGDKKKGSGLGIYISDQFIYTTDENCNMCTKNLESLFITTTNTSKPITIGVIYRPPSGIMDAFLSEFENLVCKLPTTNVYITGDFNIDLHQPNIRNFEDKYFGNGLSPLISIATHTKPGCRSTCIDNIFTNSTESVLLTGTCESSVSHHLPIFCFLDRAVPSKQKDQQLPRYDVCETNMNNFLTVITNKIGSIDLTQYNENSFENFATCLSETVDDCFLTDVSQMKSKRNRLVNPWITSGIIASISKKNFLYKKWKKTVSKKCLTGNVEFYTSYKELQKSLKDK